MTGSEFFRGSGITQVGLPLSMTIHSGVSLRGLPQGDTSGRFDRGHIMVSRHAISAAAFAMLLAWIGPAAAFEDAKYPDLSGQWLVVRPRVAGLGQFPFDPVKPWGKGQEAPLTPEYQAVHDASLADQANGGQGNWPSGERCMPAGMPAMMNGYGDLE